MRGLSLSLLIILIVLLLTPCPILAQFVVEKIEDHGSDANRMVWVIMGDGYTSLQLDDFHQDVEGLIDEFFALSPWTEYKNFINIYRIDVISNESGADHPSSNIYVDTALDATYDTYGISRLLTVNDSRAFDFASAVSSFDAVMVIVNDPQYGGSGGATSVFSNHESSSRIGLHEAGHLIGGLADEYETPYPGFPEGDSEPNVTYQTEFEYIPWKNWIENGTPLPTPEIPNEYGVGIYEGARYRSTGIYRPTYNSLMRSLNAPYGPINSEALIINLYDYVDPIDESTPAEDNVFLSPDSYLLQFSVKLADPYSESVMINWMIDGVIQESENDDTLTIDASTLKKGSHEVKVLVTDYTSLVRNDPQGLLSSSRTWRLKKESESGVISGTVVNAINNRGIEGIQVEAVAELAGPWPGRQADGQAEVGEYSTTTEADGSYLLSLVSEGVYNIIVSGEGYSSTSKSNIKVIDGETTIVNISLNPLFNTYCISGHIMGNVKEGVTINLKQGEDIFLSSTTNADGSYSFDGLENGSYTLIPNISEYIFYPPFYELTVEDRDLTGIDFKALAGLCPAQVVLEDQSSFLDLLRTLRDKILAKNELGRKYTSLYYRHAIELTSLIIKYEEIREDTTELILDILPDITSIIDGEEVILRSEIREGIEDLIDTLESHASLGLRNTLKMMRKDIRNKRVFYKFGIINP
ncbi:MAG: hypothetical protein AMJ42_05125 [Deltaproteobacteria bacterium DG_8]|nr:MAG: hypothetical protein AMJ42_05125 [Deltaproteobacteria bacterium DG_8]